MPCFKPKSARYFIFASPCRAAWRGLPLAGRGLDAGTKRERGDGAAEHVAHHGGDGGAVVFGGGADQVPGGGTRIGEKGLSSSRVGTRRGAGRGCGGGDGMGSKFIHEVSVVV